MQEARRFWQCLWYVGVFSLCLKMQTHGRVVVFFSGHKYWVVHQLKTRSTAGNISEFGFPSSVRQIDAAVHVAEYGKTIFFVGQIYYR